MECRGAHLTRSKGRQDTRRGSVVGERAYAPADRRFRRNKPAMALSEPCRSRRAEAVFRRCERSLSIRTVYR